MLKIDEGREQCRELRDPRPGNPRGVRAHFEAQAPSDGDARHASQTNGVVIR